MGSLPDRNADDDPDESSRETVLPLRTPWIDERDLAGVSAVLGTGALAMGRRTEELETRFAAYVGSKHAVAVNSSWAGFHLALEALGVGPGDEVLTSAGVTPAVAAAIAHLGARAVLVDVGPETLTLDPEEAGRKVTARTRAIVPVHFGGCPAAMDEILALAARHQLRIVEDALHALPAQYRGRMVGSIGEVTVFGLAVDLAITAGDGAILTTDDPELAGVFRGRRFYGVGLPAGRLLRRDGPRWRERGYGYAIPDLNAALGLEQLRKLPMFHGIRSYYATMYHLGLSDLRELVLPDAPPDVQHAWGLYVIRLRLERLTIGRNRFIDLLERENVRAAVHFVPLSADSHYREVFGLEPADAPGALEASRCSVSLPLYPRMSEADVWDVIRSVRKVVEQHRARPV